MMTIDRFSSQISSSSCQTWGGFYDILSWIDLFNSTLLPFSAMIVSTIVINNHLAQSRKKLAMGKNSFSCEPGNYALGLRTSQPVDQSQALSNQTSNFSQVAVSNSLYNNARNPHRCSSKREQKDRSFTFTSLAINVIFFIMNIGIVIMNLLASYNELDANQYMLFSGVTNCLFFTDFSIKFFIYSAANAKFRNEFFELISIVSCRL